MPEAKPLKAAISLMMNPALFFMVLVTSPWRSMDAPHKILESFRPQQDAVCRAWSWCGPLSRRYAIGHATHRIHKVVNDCAIVRSIEIFQMIVLWTSIR